LVWAFVDEFAKTFNKDIQSIERESLDALEHYSWPGNVRELRNIIERAMIVATGSRLRIQLPATPALSPPTSGRKLEEVEREHVLNVLEKSGWRIRGGNGAAEKLGLKATTLEARMAKLGIRRPNSGADL
jgi:formate hydrogenlyase transcriptional activator